MSPTATIVLIVVAILVIAAVVVYAVRIGRSRKLKSTFGPEYDRVVADSGNRTEAEKELRERERRHAELELRPLSPESQAKYSAAWEEVQITFVDSPKEAVSTADELVTRLIAERGYPTGDYDTKLADLSVEHAGTLQHYRDAHAISDRNTAGEASTEDLRQALVHYRALFADLLGVNPVSPAAPSTATSATPSSSADPSTTSSANPSTTPSADSPAASDSDTSATANAPKTPAPAPRKPADEPTTAPDTRR